MAESSPGSAVTLGLVVRSSRLTGADLVEIIGTADRAWTAGERPSAKTSGWQISETLSPGITLDDALARLLTRIGPSLPVIGRLVGSGDVDTFDLWIWGRTPDEAMGLGLSAGDIAELARLGAALQVSIVLAEPNR